MSTPEVTIVVVAFNIPRELPRTLYSLSTNYQQKIIDHEYEVIVVDNGIFEAAAVMTAHDSIDRFFDKKDSRPKTILAMNREIAYALAEYTGE